MGRFSAPKPPPEREFWGTNFGDDAMTNDEAKMVVRGTFESIRRNAEYFYSRGIIEKDELKIVLSVLAKSQAHSESAFGKFLSAAKRSEIM